MERFLEFTIAEEKNGALFADLQKDGRSGHLGHALVEYKKGHIMAFYSNCSGKRNASAPGHNGFGWLEYRCSADGGMTWDEAKVLSYSWNAFLNEVFTVSCEKAVSTKDNEIVALCLRNLDPNGWDPYLAPVALRSEDGGRTWSEPIAICEHSGRIYDAIVADGVIYILMLAHNGFEADSPEARYRIYESHDGGKSFSLRGEIPGDVQGYAYGSMTLAEDGALICYEYAAKDEYHLNYQKSYDMGVTWSEFGKSYCAKRIRNPQVAKVKGGYLLHGRSGCASPELPMYFVLYTSKDGIHWDEGEYLNTRSGNYAYYSNNLVLDEGKKVLIQSSVPYDKGCVNVAHWLLEIKPEIKK